VHALAAIQGRLDKPDLKRLTEATTQACLEQRKELDRLLERQAKAREREAWDREPTREEDEWAW
jgi:hypothetical protein